MNAGKLNRVIFIDRETTTINAAGYDVTTWSLIGTVRAEVLDHVTDEAGTGYGEAQTAGINFRTRYFAGLTTADRIRFLGRTYNVIGMAELGIRAGLEIKAALTE